MFRNCIGLIDERGDIRRAFQLGHGVDARHYLVVQLHHGATGAVRALRARFGGAGGGGAGAGGDGGLEAVVRAGQGFEQRLQAQLLQRVQGGLLLGGGEEAVDFAGLLGVLVVVQALVGGDEGEEDLHGRVERVVGAEVAQVVDGVVDGAPQGVAVLVGALGLLGFGEAGLAQDEACLLYTSPSPRDRG